MPYYSVIGSATTQEIEMSKRVMVGDVRRAFGRDFIVLRTERGRGNEARTMAVVGATVASGVAYAKETRSLATVCAWQKIGRMRVSLREGGGYYVAPWKGLDARLESDG
jgi:hypothetical protein